MPTFNHAIGLRMVSCGVMELDPEKAERENHNPYTKWPPLSDVMCSRIQNRSTHEPRREDAHDVAVLMQLV